MSRGSKKEVGVDLGLTEEEKTELHRIAQEVIEKKSKGQEIPSFSTASDKNEEPLCVCTSAVCSGAVSDHSNPQPRFTERWNGWRRLRLSKIPVSGR